jgi:hypothetical protein
VPVGLTVPIKGDTANLDAALDKSGGSVKGFGGILGGIPPVALGAAAGVGIAAAAVVKLTEAAAADRDEQAKLELAISAAGAATATSTDQVNAAIAAGQDRAFTDSQTRDALTSLVTATGDVTTATALLSDAQDIARFAGVDLAVASDAVAKAQAGQDGQLRKLVPGLAKGATATDTIALASKRAAGQADLYANSTAGMGARSADAFAEIGESVGSAFLPALDAILPALLPVLKSLAELVSAILPLIIPLIKILGAALGVVAKVLSTVVGWLVQLVTWLTRAIDKLGKFLDKINPLKGLKLPSLPFLSSMSAAAPAASARGAPAARGVSSGGITVNVTGAIDPEATARQIRKILAGHAVRTGSGAAI